jgi:NitT/TauT family transport system substrate-binding protein
MGAVDPSRHEESTMSQLVLSGSLKEFFKLLVEEVIQRQRVSLAEVTEFYVVNLLSEFAAAEKLFTKDLEGKTIGGPANDGALKLFPAFAKAAKIDASKVNITNMTPNLREQMLRQGQVDAVFGFVNTIWFSAKAIGIDPEKDLRFISYADHGLDLYSNAIVVSRQLAKDNPNAVRGLLKAINRAIGDTLANPEAAMDTVLKREPLVKRDIEKERLLYTIKEEMSGAEMAKIGLGDVLDERLERSINVVVEANGLTRKPAKEEVFSRAFLPPRADRPSKLTVTGK